MKRTFRQKDRSDKPQNREVLSRLVFGKSHLISMVRHLRVSVVSFHSGLLTFVILPILLTSCSGTQFGSSSDTKTSSNLRDSSNGKEKSGNPSGKKDETSGDSKGGDANSEGGVSDQTADGDDLGTSGGKPGSAGSVGSESDASQNSGNPGGSGSGGGNALNSSCLAKKAKDYNIVVVIDNSGSQKETDPSNFRLAATRNFIKDLEGFSKANTQVKIESGIVAFSDTAWQGASGPVDLAVNASKLETDIAALESTVRGNTNYEAALILADQMLKSMGAVKGQTSQRNFVIFLSDGMPTRFVTSASNDSERTKIIQDKVQGLVSAVDVAMITVASGSQISPEGIQVIQNMALPSAGTISPEHVGKYLRAADDKALQDLSKSLGAIISDCKMP